MNNYIYDYYSKIKSGEIIVGKWVVLAYESIIQGIEAKRFNLNIKKANKYIRFIETFCRHNEGGCGLIELELWQKALISVMFGILKDDGYRYFNEFFIVMGRKNGKSTLMSAIMAALAYIDGEYGGKLYCIAPKLEQAAIVYNSFYQMVVKDDELSQMAKKRRTDVYIEENNTTIKALAFSAKKSDGLNPSACILDEVSSWQGDSGIKMYQVLRSSLGARKQPLVISITTSGYINDGAYDELMKRGTSILNGSSEEKKMFPLLYMIDDLDKWDNFDELAKANPNLGVSVSVDFLVDEIAIANNSLSKKAEFLTKYCNIKQNSSIAWLDYRTVDNASKKIYSLDDFRDCYGVGGIDLSQTTDLTASSIVIEKGGELYSFTQFFMPETKVRELQEREGVPYEIFVKQGLITVSGENYVDYKDVYNWFTNLVEEYKIYPLKIGYDRYSAQYLVEDLKAYGFHMDDVFQGDNLSPVITEFEGILKDGIFNIGQNNLLKAHFLNVALKQNMETRKNRMVKIEQRSHIDGTVSIIDALTVRQKWYADIGKQLKNE